MSHHLDEQLSRQEQAFHDLLAFPFVEALFQPHEWQALYAFTQRTTLLPATPPSLQQVVRWVAQLGGFLGRTSDGDPGVQTIWRGLRRLDDLVAMWLLLHSSSPPASLTYG